MEFNRFLYYLGAVVVGMLFLIYSLVGQAADSPGYADKKAEFLYNFTKSKYIEWPDEAIDDEFLIGVLQDTAVYNALSQLTDKKMFLFRKSVNVKAYQSLDEVGNCHILYFNRQVPYSVETILDKIGDHPTLLVGSNFPFNAVMVNFVPVQEDVSIDVNRDMIEEQGLTPRNNLLDLKATSEEQWNQMLRNAQTRLQRERQEVQQQERLLAAQQDSLQAAVKQLEQRKDHLQRRTLRLKHMYDSLLQARQEIEKQDMILMEKKEQLRLHRQIRYGMVAIIVLALGLIFFIYRSYRINKKSKEELQAYNKILEDKNKRITEQKDVIERKNRDITASIRYAERIQSAIMPPRQYVEQYIPESFILFRPKEMVSGDFYWVKSIDDKHLLFSVVDCTGHGVPGAFISIVAYNSLVRAINEFELRQPSHILDKLNVLVKEALQKEHTDLQDGMDMALCLLNFEDQTLQYAGANNPLYLVRDGTLHETKADKQPIGSYDFSPHFTNHQFDIKDYV